MVQSLEVAIYLDDEPDGHPEGAPSGCVPNEVCCIAVLMLYNALCQ
jgi:hypothetical protein